MLSAFEDLTRKPWKLRNNLDLPRIRRWEKVMSKLRQLDKDFEDSIRIRLRQSEHFRAIQRDNPDWSFDQCKEEFKRGLWSGAR